MVAIFRLYTLDIRLAANSLIKHQVFRSSFIRSFSNSESKRISKMKGLVLGVYTKPSALIKCNEVANLTKAAKEVDEICKGKLSKALEMTGPFFKSSKHKFLYSIPEIDNLEVGGTKYNGFVVVDLGDETVKRDDLEERDQKLENIRCAIADGVKALSRNGGFKEIHVDSCGYSQCVAEAATLSLYAYDELKHESARKPNINLQLYNHPSISAKCKKDWEQGLIIGDSQNFARTLMETPANLMTPEIFASKVAEKLKSTAVEVIPRDLEWIKEQKMGSYLSVTKGSDEKPVFLELHYQGSPETERTIAFVGKGITFDSGGISLKPSPDMDKMRADMGGAACVSATINAIARLKLKINVKGFIPLCENLPSGKASKPGDVVYAMNGKSIQIDNTDAEGRLVLADALCYAQTFKPSVILDVATLTGAIMVALGSAATGVYSNNQYFWELLQKAGYHTGDRVWRMPLFNHFTKQVTDCHLADINNIGKGGRYGGSCTAAAFLKEFVASDMKWLHLDIAGVMENKDEVPYLCSGMSGRPTRTLVEFLRIVSDGF